MILINPGSGNKGGTIEQARINAKHWLDNIHEEGFVDVEMDEGVEDDGMFDFNFTHKVTGKVVVLSIHGFTNEELEEFMFPPRVYWNGGSSSTPKIEDWLAEGFKFKITYYEG